MKKLLIFVVLCVSLGSLQAQVHLKNTLSQRRHQLVCADFSPDGQYLVTGGLDSRVYIWNAQKGEVERELRGVRQFPLSVRFSNDGNHVVAGGKDSRVTIWDAHSGERLFSLRGHRGDVTSVSISPDNQFIASAGHDRTIRVWRLRDGELIHTMRGHRGEVMSVDFSHDGSRLVSGSADGTVRVWNASTGDEIASFKAHDGWVRAVAFSPNGNFIASGGDDATIHVYNAFNYELQNTIIPHSGWIETLAFSPDGRYIVSGAHDNYLVMLEARSGRVVFNSDQQSYYVLSVAFNPNGREFVSATLFSNDLMVWNTEALNIEGAVFDETIAETEPEPEREAPTISWLTSQDLETSNLTHRLSYEVTSGYPIEQLVVYLNDQRYLSRDNVAIPETGTLTKESVVYLKEGENKAAIELYYRGGIVTSEALTLHYVPEVVAVVEPEPEEIISEPEVAETPMPVEVQEGVSDLMNLPFRNPPNPYRFALIIGNEDYSSYQIGLDSESNVDFAIADAKAFKAHAINVFGVPEDNIILLKNARAVEMFNEIDKIKHVIRALNGKAEIIFYYAGHGFPDEQTREPYLIPVDVTGTNLRFAVKINDLYKELTEYPSERITVFLDACFSGGARNVGLVSARGVRVRPQDHLLQGNLVVFSASSDNQSAHPYRDKEHGIFTYFLLNKLRETRGNISYKELSDYISETVGVRSVFINNTEQTPQTNVSPAIENIWHQWSIKE